MGPLENSLERSFTVHVFYSQETGIIYGFRKPNEPWLYYFASLFQPHNELLNMWTHLVGMILVIMRGISMQKAEGKFKRSSVHHLFHRGYMV